MKAGRIAGYAAFGAALTYTLLKVAWIAGSSVGISEMRGLSRADWMAGNISTAGLGIVGAIVALATVRSWGTRIPLWLIAVPMWVGAGLLAPFTVLMPAAALFVAAGWWAPPATAADGTEPTLEPWTFVIVYGSFIVLGAGLAVAFPVYAWARFRTALLGTVGQVPAGSTHLAQVPLAWAAAVLATGLAGLRLSWAFGGTVGLHPGPRDVWLRLGDVVAAMQILCAVLGVLVLVHRWGKERRFTLPLIATWLGAGGMVGTGFLSMPTILSGDQWAPTGQTFAAYATGTFLTCVAGGLISLVALFLLLERRAVAAENTAARAPAAAG